MQRAKAVEVYGQDLKDVISELRKEAHRKALGGAHDIVALRLIEHKVRSDFQLTRDDRLELLAEVELASASFGMAGAAE